MRNVILVICLLASTAFGQSFAPATALHLDPQVRLPFGTERVLGDYCEETTARIREPFGELAGEYGCYIVTLTAQTSSMALMQLDSYLGRAGYDLLTEDATEADGVPYVFQSYGREQNGEREGFIFIHVLTPDGLLMLAMRMNFDAA